MQRNVLQEAALIPTNVGVGLRSPHYHEILANQPVVGWFEAHSENYFGEGGQPLAMLSAIRANYPVSLHGVGLSLGSCDPINTEHIRKLKRLVDRIEPGLVSEHLSWSSIEGRFYNELLPLPYSEEALHHVSARVEQTQDLLGSKLLIENVTAYVAFNDSTMPEWEFLNSLAKRTGCGLLLDVNNVYVNSMNHQFDALQFLSRINPAYVEEIHLAGFDRAGDILVDTHGAKVSEAVWRLYAFTLDCIGRRPTLVEWDNDIPALSVLLDEARHAENIMEQCHALAA